SLHDQPSRVRAQRVVQRDGGLLVAADGGRHRQVGHRPQPPWPRSGQQPGQQAFEFDARVGLERLLPRLLAGSGPRWLGAMADLAVAAAVSGDEEAAVALYDALRPYTGRLVV